MKYEGYKIGPVIRDIRKVKRQINPKLEIEGILLTMVDNRTNYAKDISALVVENYGSKVRIFENSIPMSVRAAEISAEGVSIYEHDPNGKVASAYGLMLDRMSLSMKNEWFDDENRAYIIYTIDSIMEDLGCAKEKAVKVLAELDSVKGIGLVEKVRRGLGKPDIIYVKNFASISEQMDEKEPANADEITEVGKSNFKKSENRTSGSQKIKLQEVRKSNFRKSENQTSGSSEIEPQEVGESNPNYTNYNQTYMNQTIAGRRTTRWNTADRRRIFWWNEKK